MPIADSPASAAFPGANGKIAFYSNRDGNYEIYAMSADGSSQVRLTNNAATDSDPVWSPDGTKISFYSDRAANYEIYVMDADGTSQTRLTNNAASDFTPSWQRVLAPSVGGIAEQPDVTALPTAVKDSVDRNTAYAVGGAVALLAAFMLFGGWRLRRRTRT